jgi:hypothetical protein
MILFVIEINSHPQIKMNYLSTERDQEVAIESIEITREIVSCMDPKFNPRERKPGLQYKTKEELVKAAGGLLFFTLPVLLISLSLRCRYWNHNFSSCGHLQDGALR